MDYVIHAIGDKETNDVLRIMIMRSKIETYYNY